MNFVSHFHSYDQVRKKNPICVSWPKGKGKGSFLSFLRARDVLKKRFGKVYVRFHEPLSFRKFCRIAGYEIQPGCRFSERTAGPARLRVLPYVWDGPLGSREPVDLIAAALISRGVDRIGSDRLASAVEQISAVVEHGGFEFADTASNAESAIRSALECFRLEDSSRPRKIRVLAAVVFIESPIQGEGIWTSIEMGW